MEGRSMSSDQYTMVDPVTLKTCDKIMTRGGATGTIVKSRKHVQGFLTFEKEDGTEDVISMNAKEVAKLN